ncbi:hypothetical protein AB0F71_38165 [Kitasatospora sp. NPDC028055]|uniref:hypothetical protein n=1 Tax=Kitasatospora sp. NPDC028055 TaxID=3155653 RepID=UPI0034013952
MDQQLRRAAVTALGALAHSPDFRDRAAAGHGLAAFADLPEARGPLLALVLDPDDTYVTRVTARALLRRKDRAGLTAVATALADADPNHEDWIHSAVVDALGIFASDREEALLLCHDLSRGPDPRLADGARRLHAMLTELDPALRSA